MFQFFVGLICKKIILGQGNRIAGGTQQASANAPAFFAGKEESAHTHQASLSGIKTQQLATTKSGQGGYNQLVFDDTPGEARIELGTVPAWSQPRLQFAAPAGIAQLTPEHHLLATGKHLAIATGHDTNLIAQGNHSLAVKDGIALFTVGKASNKNKPNQETGIHLHAASGSVSVQSQSGKTTAAADKKVTIASTTGKLTASAKQKVLATAQGAYLKIEGGNIELHAPKKVEFKASKKEWTGPKAGSPTLPAWNVGELNIANPPERKASCLLSASRSGAAFVPLDK